MNLRKLFTLLLASLLPIAFAACKSTSYHEQSGITAGDESSEVHISKMGGDIDVDSAPHGANLSTMGGNIHVGNVADSATLKTMGGAIDVDNSTGPVDANTMGGNVTISTADGPVKATTMGGDITVRETGASAGERDIELSSKGGTIELTVPKDFPMSVRIMLAYTKADRGYHIEQHAGLEVQETDEWDNSHGTPRKYIRAAGRVGNGLNKVSIDTINGDVILRQE
jgi:DUF4097 and DUF4098 domain-containing protein YvlB